MRAIVVVNSHKEEALTLASSIEAALRAEGCASERVESGSEGDVNLADCGIALSLGGDGTVIWTARKVAERGIPILPVNLGTLGFIAAVGAAEWKGVFDAWREGRVALSRRIMLDVRVFRSGHEFFHGICLNDAVLSSWGSAKIIRLSAFDGSLPLATYRADGLLIATPTGGTAYCAAAGGPILDPEMSALILNPICPFTLSRRPLVLPAEKTLTIRVDSGQRGDTHLTLDGRENCALKEGDEIAVSRAASETVLVASDRVSFYRALLTKLP